MASVNWDTVEAALVARVRATLGFADGQVVMAEQGGPRRTRPFVEISLGDMVPLGAYDPTVQTFDATGGAGEEIVMTTTGKREFSLTLQAFSDVVRGQGTARALLALAGVGLQTPASKAVFDISGFTVVRALEVKKLTGVLLKTKYESRAALTVLCRATVELVERTGYIDNGAVALTNTGITYPI